MIPIDYHFIQQAIQHYQEYGYDYVEVPWLIGREALDVTRPWGSRPLRTCLGHLVASGEQSFLDLAINNRLVPGNYCCCTPCFRDEPILDEIHRSHFMKVELITIGDHIGPSEVEDMVDSALVFFAHYLRTEVVKTSEGFDIEYRGLELGSYGLRSYKDLRWAYGTGVAEPRLSQAIKLRKNQHA